MQEVLLCLLLLLLGVQIQHLLVVMLLVDLPNELVLGQLLLLHLNRRHDCCRQSLSS